MRLVDLNVAIKLDNNEKVIDFLKNTESDIITLQESMRGIDNTVYDRYNNSKLIKEAVKNTHKYDFYGALWVSDKHIKATFFPILFLLYLGIIINSAILCPSLVCCI